MNSKTLTRQRSAYSGSRITTAMPLTRIGTGSNTDYFAYTGAQPWITTSLRTLFEEASVDKDGNNRNTWNDFEHYKVTASYPDSDHTYMVVFSTPNTFSMRYNDPGMCWPTSSEFGSQDNPTVGLPQLYQKDVATGNFVPLVSGVNTLINKAVAAMLGSVRPEVSLINSLIELKDFRRLPDTISRVKSTLKLARELMQSKTFRYVGFNAKRNLMDILGGMADVFLQSEFNIKPLLSDVEGIQRSLNDLHQRLQKRMSDEGVLRRRDFNISLPGFGDSFKQSPNVAYPESSVVYGPAKEPRFILGSSTVLRQVRYQRAQFHAQIEYSQYWSEYQRQNALILALLDRLGVNFNPAIVWNAIPWSFVVDWVVNISSWLKQFGTSNTEPVTIIHKFCWSQNIVRTINCVIQAQHVYSNKFKGSSRSACFITESSYRRSTQGLNVIASLTGTGISPKEFLLGSALAISRRRRNNK